MKPRSQKKKKIKKKHHDHWNVCEQSTFADIGAMGHRPSYGTDNRRANIVDEPGSPAPTNPYSPPKSELYPAVNAFVVRHSLLVVLHPSHFER
jgi:hypothetical protein